MYTKYLNIDQLYIYSLLLTLSFSHKIFSFPFMFLFTQNLLIFFIRFSRFGAQTFSRYSTYFLMYYSSYFTYFIAYSRVFVTGYVEVEEKYENFCIGKLMFFVVENNLFCRKCGIYSEKKRKI